MSKANFLVASALLLIATVSQAAEVVGHVGYMSGTLVAQRADGTVLVMGTKSEVQAGDMLVTAKDSYVQVQMIDGAKMTLRPNSNLKIEEYQFNRQEPASDNAIFRLLKGGLRTVTGLIGKRGDPDAYKMRAASATIGIRGTDFSSRLCATANCQDDMAANHTDKPQAAPAPAAGGAPPPPAAPTEAPPGLYVTVHNGQVVLAQADKTLNLGRGETGFANAAALVRLPAPPAFMNTDTKQTNAIEAKASKAEESKAGNKSDEGKTKGKTDKEKDGVKPDQEKDNSKPDGEKTGGKSDEEKAGAKPDAVKDSINPEGKNADSADPTVNKSGCVVQ